MNITLEIWARCREGYIRGQGSLAAIAKRHDLRKGSVEKRASKEDWTGLRAQYEALQLGKLIPPLAPAIETPASPSSVITTEWLENRLQIHYHKTTELIDKARGLLNFNLSAEKKPGADELAKLCSAVNALVTAEAQLLGLKNRSKGKGKDLRSKPTTYEPSE